MNVEDQVVPPDGAPPRSVPRSIVLRVRHPTPERTRAYVLDDLAAEDDAESVLATLVIGSGTEPGTLVIRELTVVPEWRGLGLATRLLSGTIDLWRRDGVWRVTVRGDPAGCRPDLFVRQGFVATTPGSVLGGEGRAAHWTLTLEL